MQRELGQILADQRDQAGVVGPGRDFGKLDFVAVHEQLDAEDAPPAESLRDRRRDLLGAFPRAACDIGCGCHDSR
ncbi:MAG: hypothetical protein MPW14_15455 [Candidatus Manganitrophus sp.]|nr:MAG: hypothetical protein MPW14_15455 [Candidatus Manganitrophus sp.]